MHENDYEYKQQKNPVLIFLFVILWSLITTISSIFIHSFLEVYFFHKILFDILFFVWFLICIFLLILFLIKLFLVPYKVQIVSTGIILINLRKHSKEHFLWTEIEKYKTGIYANLIAKNYYLKIYFKNPRLRIQISYTSYFRFNANLFSKYSDFTDNLISIMTKNNIKKS